MHPHFCTCDDCLNQHPLVLEGAGVVRPFMPRSPARKAVSAIKAERKLERAGRALERYLRRPEVDRG